MFRPCDACSNFEPEKLSKTGTGVLLASSHCAAAAPHLLLLQVTGSTWPLQALEFVTLPLYYFLGPCEVTEPSFLFSSVKPSFFLWGCAGSLWLSQAFCNCSERGLLCFGGVWFSHCGGFYCHEACAPGMRAQELSSPGLGAPQHGRSFWRRDPTHVPCFGRQILNH